MGAKRIFAVIALLLGPPILKNYEPDFLFNNYVPFLYSVSGVLTLYGFGYRFMKGRMPFLEPPPCDGYAARPPKKLKEPKSQWRRYWWHKQYPCARCGHILYKHDKRSDHIKDWIVKKDAEWKAYFRRQRHTLKAWHEKDAEAALRAVQEEIMAKTAKEKERLNQPSLTPAKDSGGESEDSLMQLSLFSTDKSGGKVWIGSIEACEPGLLTKLGIKHVINTANSTAPTPYIDELVGSGFSILEMELNTTSSTDFESHVSQSAAYIKSALDQGESVLVFGGKGIGERYSLAPPTALLMAQREMDLETIRDSIEAQAVGKNGRRLGFLGRHLDVTSRMTKFQKSPELLALRQDLVRTPPELPQLQQHLDRLRAAGE
mmetsp:Transcript_28713/g.40023  ORF Transcript_28713/g.40023 Transcript_28713/m.40023 type:complete len:374 (+) Transcript_28713:18-1139(+)